MSNYLPIIDYEDPEASDKAAELLLKQISKEEYQCFKKNKYIPVAGKERIYNLYLRPEWNIEFYKDGYKFWGYSLIPNDFDDGIVPLLDSITSQYINLKINDTEYLEQFCVVNQDCYEIQSVIRQKDKRRREVQRRAKCPE